MHWLYQGRNKAGKPVNGVIQASTILVAQIKLRQLGITAAKVELKTKPSQTSQARDLFVMLGSHKLGIKSEFSWFIPLHQVKSQQVQAFIRQFAVVLKAGIPLLHALTLAQQPNKKFARVLQDIKSHIENGASLSEAFAQYPTIFDNLFINFLAIGEQSGMLDVLLMSYVQHMDKVTAMWRKLKTALTYPLVVLVIAVAVIAIMLMVVVPSFAKMFVDFDLPLITQWVINSAQWVTSYWWLGVLLLVTIILLVRYALAKYSWFRYQVEWYLFAVPLLGNLWRKAIISRWSRTLSLLCKAGVPLNESLRSIARLVNNHVYGAATLLIEQEISAGMSLAAAVTETRVFPDLVTQMIAAGEESGELELLLEAVADYYMQDVELLVDIILAMLEPITIVFLGIILGAIIVAVYLPIFNLGNLLA